MTLKLSTLLLIQYKLWVLFVNKECDIKKNIPVIFRLAIIRFGA